MNFIISLIIFFIAVIIHEYSHGYVAYKLGDPTAKYSGRLTLNPLAHIDPFGTIILPLILVVMHSPFVFGWAKPVPINFWNLRKPKRDMVLVGLAGPSANLLFAFIASILLKSFSLPFYIQSLIHTAILLNLVLAVFNLIPIPPLDGSRILAGFLKGEMYDRYQELEPYGLLIIPLLLFLGLFDRIIFPFIIVLMKLLLGAQWQI